MSLYTKIKYILHLLSILNVGVNDIQNVYPTKRVAEQIYLQYYTGNTIYDNVRYRLSDALDIINQFNFDSNKKTVVYLHGFNENPELQLETQSIYMMAKELTARDDVNLIVADYHSLVRIVKYRFISRADLAIAYLRSVHNVPKIGRALGTFLRMFIQQCNGCQDRLHLIGFSLGAHVAHYISQILKIDGFTVPRITGLEPAAPLYEGNSLKEHLTVNDANFVDIVHSDAGRFGWSQFIGHVDFWPNTGKSIQPYCLLRNDPSAKCSHYTSVFYYAESVNNPTNFLAVQCDSENSWKADVCSGRTEYFGYNNDLNLRGNYYFSTNGASPFGKGLQGVRPNE